MWEGELYSLIHIAWQVHVCTPNKLYLFPFSTSTSQRSMTSLSAHLLGCLVRDMNYEPWPVTHFFKNCSLIAEVTTGTVSSEAISAADSYILCIVYFWAFWPGCDRPQDMCVLPTSLNSLCKNRTTAVPKCTSCCTFSESRPLFPSD